MNWSSYFILPRKVSAILPVAQVGRIKLARNAVNTFLRQYYTPCELIIVNGTSEPVITNDFMETDEVRSAGHFVTEIHVPEGLNAATMRNHGLEAATGDWIICIDDDDHFHPLRLMYQMAQVSESSRCVCMLRYQLRIDVSMALLPSVTVADGPEPPMQVQPLLHLLKQSEGIPCTMLFPRVMGWRFNEELNTGEFEELLSRMKQADSAFCVCDNRHTPFLQTIQLPLLSIAVYHGGNELSYEQFFQTTTLSSEGKAPEGLNVADMDYLKGVLAGYNFKVN
jgi:teichuronic acid biosynthesis glycosyltransferase TuaG